MVLNPDDQATFDELTAHYNDADTAYNFAAVNQQRENAAEVALLKAAEEAAAAVAREEREFDRGLAIQSLKDQAAIVLEEQEFDTNEIESLKENIKLTNNEDDKKLWLGELSDMILGLGSYQT